MVKENDSEKFVGISDSLSESEKVNLGKRSTEYIIKKFDHLIHPKYDPSLGYTPNVDHVKKKQKKNA